MTAGLYIHIPFCEKRCGYCDFYTLAHRESTIPTYMNSLKKEIQLYSEDQTISDLIFETLYFGGGTPSLLEVDQISSLLNFIFSKFNFVHNPEVTIEANPGTVDLEKLIRYRESGINRISLGIQSFQLGELKLLDRNHTVAEALTCFNKAKKVGFENISIDLIFALPEQTLEAWGKNLELAVDLEPNHISAYNLTYEVDIPLTLQLKNNKIKTCSEEMQRKMYLTTMEFLQVNGFIHYEISNYAKPGYESQHNQKYWDGSPYLGLGTSAHSFIKGRRFWNVSNLRKYITSLSENKLPLGGEEFLGLDEASFEKVFLGLRQRRGLQLKNFELELGISLFEKYLNPLSSFFSCNLRDEKIVAELINGSRNLKSRLLKIEDGFLKLTKEGVLLCDSICAEFV
ncbi:MAG: radical SAM family heme chaperone HemW [bacterium]